ncbi:hypothetical protein [Thermorudis peleae]|uniref:hypothetical protein n=1 Tax=Thermorudis peleae TaxID=1382356 RepID=UPI0005719E3A|nr:hypothetical protein [Thermorudis peleae]
MLRPISLPQHAEEAERRAFLRLRPLTPSYQTAPITTAFNWDEALADIETGEWYLVVFRSQRKTTANEVLLTEFDDEAYEEAMATGGLLCYFAGELDDERYCLSFCVWRSQADAQRSARLPKHARAAQLAPETYTWFVLERYRLFKEAGDPKVKIEPLMS